MDVLVAGAHGKVGQHVTELLAGSEHGVRGMVHDPKYAADIEALDAEPVVADLTDPVSLPDAVGGCDAVVFAAGSSGADVWGVDCEGAKHLVDAAGDAGADRFVMLSAMNADAPEEGPEELREYLRAKAEADAYLRESDRTDTIVRPGALTDDPGTGRVRTGRDLDRGEGTIPREDVAETLVTALPMASTHGVTFEVLSGDDPIERALDDPVDDA
ncbi:SDR family oxidoreductase [Halocalculus aciditolerans]|uniref:NAD dependent epimerase/dehydratase n=1 Tax=Halocalculus aciditolerans TaxID=1383812 RepID=A0A830FJB6_9EURY|nr:SDR family oxidoreductase [Halocalculus aciditolerans]GGL52577.1 NAD dependent epimerase/dehydratase [Halocalculus aciditolerans]